LFESTTQPTVGADCEVDQSQVWIRTVTVPLASVMSRRATTGVVTSADVTDSTSAWTQATVTLTAPANAAWCRVNAQVKAAGGASEVHYLDDVTLTAAYELAYADVTVAIDDATIWNGAIIANNGGNAQVAADALSQALNGPIVYDQQALIADSDWQSANYAQFIVAAASTFELRFDVMTVDPTADPANLFPQVLGRQLGDRITVKRRPPGGGAAIIRDVIIRGISHQFTDSTWSTAFVLQDASRLPSAFIIGDATNGVIGVSKIGY